MSTLVCGVDLGPSGVRVARVAAEVSRVLDVGISLVHAGEVGHRVEPGLPEGLRPAAEALAARAEALHRQAEDALRGARARIEALGGRVVSARVVEGHPWEVVCAEARALTAPLVVVGPHGAVRPIDRLLGSTAENVLRHAPCPVLVAIGDGEAPVIRGREIAVAIDGSGASLAALRAASTLFGPAGATMHAVCVSSAPVEIVGALEAVKAASPAPIGWSVVEGQPADAIVRTAQDRRATMIAIGTHGRAGLARWALGAVDGDVLGRATVPVLVARDPTAE